MSSGICANCKNKFATKACTCTFPLPLTCDECFEKHSGKSSQVHRTITIEDSLKIHSQQDLHETKLRFVNIDEAENVLKNNLGLIENCRNSIEEHFDSLIYDIKVIEKKNIEILKHIKSSIEEAIFEAVGQARQHAIDKQWEDIFGNQLAKKVWEFQPREESKALNLFEYEVNRPPASLEKLMQVKMLGRVSLPALPDEPVLSIIADQYLQRFDTRTQKWNSIQLVGDVLSSWKFAWDSACAHFSDNINLLITGGGTPLTNCVYRVNMMDGGVKELAHMRSSRSGHGLAQHNGLFYAFGGYGSKRNAERFAPNEELGSWDSLGNMNAAHQWFTTCKYNDFIYLCGGDSGVVEIFNTVDSVFNVFEGFALLDAWAESSLSICIIGTEIVFVSSSMIKKWNVENNSSMDRKLVRPMRSVWSSMMPISNGTDKMYLPSQESKHVKCVDLNTGRVIEFKAPQLEGI